MNGLVRRLERQADEYAVGLGFRRELESSLIKIHKENKANLNPDWLYAAFYYNHPCLEERLGAINVL